VTPKYAHWTLGRQDGCCAGAQAKRVDNAAPGQARQSGAGSPQFLMVRCSEIGKHDDIIEEQELDDEIEDPVETLLRPCCPY
jgi:hypothetical protein